MQQLPDLSQLSHAQKDELIHALWAMVQVLTAKVEAQQVQLQAQQRQVDELQARLNQNSRNSSKPPSSDGLNKPKPKSLRKAGERPVGAPNGHRGNTLRQVSEPDHVITHAPPEQCDYCHSRLDAGVATTLETRQVFELSALSHEVTERRVLQSRCTCGAIRRGQFPTAVVASVQYGPRVLAAVVQLNQHHMVPLKRCANLMGELFGLPMSEPTILSANAQAATLLAPTVNAIKQAFLTQPTVHVDETGLRVSKVLHWLHTLAAETLTWVGRHEKRGAGSFEHFAVLPLFKGVLIHDGWQPYRTLDCLHGLCNAHHLCEFTYVAEELKQDWAQDMIGLLTHANSCDKACCESAQQPDYAGAQHQLELRDLRDRYEAIVAQGEGMNPRAEPTGKRGRAKQSRPANLLKRLRDFGDDVWRFMSQARVPFTNNLAEQAVCMPKVKQKISGGFRTTEGADIYCQIRSYLATMHKQGSKHLRCTHPNLPGNPSSAKLWPNGWAARSAGW